MPREVSSSLGSLEIDDQLNIYQPVEQCAPERNLIAEIIYRAMRDVLNRTHIEQDRIIEREAIYWMRLDRAFFKKDSNTAYSFVWCCNILGLCPEALKEKVKELRASGRRLEV